MKKIDINLYPYAINQNNPVVQKIEQFFIFAALAAAGLIILNVILFFLASFYYIPYAGLVSRWKAVSPQAAELALLKKDGDEIKQKKQRYDELAFSRVETAQVLAELYCILPDNLWIDNLLFKETDLVFSGYVVKWKEDYLTSVDKFIKNLKTQTYFGNQFKTITQRSTRKVLVNNVEVMKIEVECKK